MTPETLKEAQEIAQAIEYIQHDLKVWETDKIQSSQLQYKLHPRMSDAPGGRNFFYPVDMDTFDQLRRLVILYLHNELARLHAEFTAL